MASDRALPSILSASAVVLAFLLVALIAVPPGVGTPGAQASHAGGMDAMSIDMDPGAAPANTATLLGSRETCARVNENDVLDADEDVNVDTLSIDVTATNIPASNPMIGWAYDLLYPTDLSVTAKNSNLLLASGSGSSVVDLSEPVPDSDGVFNATAADFGSSAASRETGSGVLQRIDLTTVPAAATDVFPLSFLSASHNDPFNATFAADAVNDAQVAINRNCPLPPVDIEIIALSLVSISGPAQTAGTNFTLQLTGTARSNGPNPADIRIDLGLSAPPDCTLAPPGNQTEDFLSVLNAETRTSVRTWTANCSDPSAHQFSATGQVTVIGLADETTPGNNGPLNDIEGVAVGADADPKLSGVTVTAPAGAATGAPFNVNVTAMLHNNGSFTPVNADTTLDLPMPAGCSRLPDNPQPINDTSLQVSTPVQVQANWTVTCITTGLKTFTGSAATVLDQLHVTDTNPNNNSGNGQALTDTSLGQADVKVSSVATVSPASAAIGANFPVIVSTVVHNNGPFFPVNADINVTLNLPADCFTPVTSLDFQNAILGPSVAALLPDVTFYVACVDHSFHNITATATIVVDDPLAGDPTPGNNSLTSAPDTTVVIRTSDMKAVSVTLGPPASAPANTPFNVTVDPTLHNNGPDSGPVDATMTLSLPPDCSAPSNPRTVSANLPVSTATPLATETFSVTCTNESFHLIEASISLSTPLHVVDTNSGNDTVASGTSSVAVIASSDLKVNAVTVGGPPSPQINLPFNITAVTTLHNNGPFGPANADVTASLNMPGDCTTTSANPQDTQDVAVPVSAATVVNSVWSVTCTAQSHHSFTATSSVALDQLHVDDPVTPNNTLASAPGQIPVFAGADGKINSAVVLNPPAFIPSNVNVPITIRKVLHNNGPFGPSTFSLTKSITPPAGCTITPPSTSSHNLAVSTQVTVDEIWTVNCNPGSYTFSFANTLSSSTLHVTDPNAANNGAITSLTFTVDTDGDGIPDDVESGCGSNPNNGLSIPERIDGVFAGVNDDLDGLTDEALPAGAAPFDCDRDGYSGTSENHVYSPSIQGDQDPCGTNTIPPTVPPTAIGWPADLAGGGIPNSTNAITLIDVLSFVAPLRYLNTNTGTNPSDRRWDLTPGPQVFPTDINIADILSVALVTPPMLGGPRAFGLSCPFPP